MADQNSYLAYKRDTRQLLYWMIHASNTIIKASASLPSGLPKGSPRSLNTTGQITVSAIVPLSVLIAERIKPIPSIIYRLFQNVIAARRASQSVFQQIVAQKPDPEIEKSNNSHKVFIDALTQAFEALGGNEWVAEQKLSKNTLEDEEDPDDVIFANSFAGLNLGGALEEDEEEDIDEEQGDLRLAQQARQKRSNGKKKKGKKGKKTKAKLPTKEASLDDVPFESYRIIEDGDGLVTEYLMAVYSLTFQWIELRSYVQGIWREVAYGA